MIFGLLLRQALGFKVFYDKPTVYQDRNVHSIYKDFILEDLVIRTISFINKILINPKKIKDFLPKRSFNALKDTRK